jgi:subtilisin family serine protease
VAKTIVEESQDSVIVNGRILGSDGTATTPALIAAIYWAVEQNCSVINLSLGSSPTHGDPTEKAIEYALSKGVVVVAAAGNEGDSGTAGTSISSPGVFLDCIAVAALDEYGEPFYFSSTGPAASRYMKPDIAAAGYVQAGTNVYYGTSFASPRVAAAAAQLVSYCRVNNRPYTAGSIMTALLKGADSMSYPEYVVGAGAVNIDRSIQVVANSLNVSELPAISYASPTKLPIDYEQLFYGDTYEFSLKLFTSTSTVFDVQISSGTPGIFDIPSTVSVDQVGFVPLKVNVPASGDAYYDGNITFVSESSGTARVTIDFSVSHASFRVAFDISHTTWSIDTIYGQFRELYKKLTSNSISVTELRNTSQIT